MGRRWGYIGLCLLLLVSVAWGQRARPDTDVSLGQSTYVFVTLQDRAIILYTIYNETTGAILGYALWNDSETTARAHLEFHVGDPIDLEAAPGTRAGARVLTRSYFMSTDSESGVLVDANVSRHSMGNDGSVDRTSRDRSFPLPRER